MTFKTFLLFLKSKLKQTTLNIMKKITDLPVELQALFAELKAEKEMEELIDCSQLATTEEDILDEAELLNTDVDADPVDENDEEQIDMEVVSPSMLSVFN